MVGPILIVGFVLVQAPPKHRKDVPDLANQSRPKEERLDGSIGADGDGAKGSRENEYGESSVIRRVCALGDAAEPGMPWEGLVTAVGEEDARRGNKLRWENER